MPVLKTLKFIAVPKIENNPVLNRRKKLLDRLTEQKNLALDPTFVRSIQKWTKKDGERVLIESKKKVRPWWRIDANGSTIFVVRQGWKPIEFETGKAGIAVPSKDKLVSIIDTLIDATNQGELDELLAKSSKGNPVGKQRKAA